MFLALIKKNVANFPLKMETIDVKTYKNIEIMTEI